MNTLLNILWLIFFGFITAIGWFLAGLVMFVSIVGIPWGRACFTIGKFVLWPFGREAVDRRISRGKGDIGTGFLGTLGNIIWFIFGGLWLAIGHLASGLLLFITIIGIPFGIQHLKIAGLALFPIGKEIVVVKSLRR
ncbi:MAG: YccF domain-containing protein [Verrucomicrobiae bacterium]|nr:YccF domain-containing protein [Verrucomicrobiae bacterium]